MTEDSLVAAVPPSGAPGRPRSRLAVAVFVGAIVVAVMAMLAGFGSRWGLWNFGTGFSILRWAAYGAIAVGLLSVVALFRTRPGGPRRGFVLAFVALLVGIVAVAVPWQWTRRAQSVPPIHDITTDTENPPEFVAVLPLRADARNSAEYEGAEVAAQQRAGYPDIRPVVLDMPQAVAFQRAYEAAVDMGWEIVAADAAAGRVEATDQTFWFGFKDDVVIRLTPLGAERTVLDVRSVSRVGGSDVGTNAERIRDYLAEVQD